MVVFIMVCCLVDVVGCCYICLLAGCTLLCLVFLLFSVIVLWIIVWYFNSVGLVDSLVLVWFCGCCFDLVCISF